MNNIQIDDLKFEIMLSSEQILNRVQGVANEINQDYIGKCPVFIGVLNGCFMFMADLMKEIRVPCEMTFVKLSSYHGTEQAHISELIGVGMDLKGRDIIIVEDVVDSGNSLHYTLEALADLEVSSIKVCSLLLKPECLQYEFPQLKYVGFEIDKEFVVGYGLDYNGLCRNLPHIYKNIPL